MTIAAVGGMFERPRHGKPSMRMNRQLAALSLAVALALPGIANANCYIVYDAKNQLVFQSTVSPVDLSKRISDSMRERFPGGHLVMIRSDRNCREVRTGSTPTPRLEAGGTNGTEAALDRSASTRQGSAAATR